MIASRFGALREIAVLGAHCDDIAIGMGATLLTLCRAHPGLRVRVFVATGAQTDRAAEETEALGEFCPDADLHVHIGDLPDGRTPAHWERLKESLAQFRRGCEPDLVFATQPDDAHQDHRELATLAPTEFRDQMILGYEIIKWENDTPTPTHYHPVTTETALDKVRLLHKCYPSQVDRDWFDDETFLGLMRIRGVQCRVRYAEAFVVAKTVIDFGGH
ncbi:PIG-L family deacetylase [Gordonia sp. VNQ95]|uniref:PIG-L deacetylase family protein n=1 Tax=Gordonia sp. VNQ95 TaxID=3156619 RepID=UPI0032B502E9